MLVGELLAHVGFKTETSPLEKLEGQLESIKEKINLIIGFEAVTKLYELAERFAHWGEELHVTAVNIGVTTEALQGLDFAAEHAGVSQEMMAHSLAHLSRELYHAKTGSAEAMMAFAKAGFSSETLSRFKTSEDALYALADRINAIQDPMQRMGVAQTLLGRGGFKMIAFLSQGSAKIKEQANELRKLGLQLSGPQVEALVQTEHAFIRLKSVMSAMGAQIASYVGPAFSYLVDKFIQLYDANQNLAHGGIKAWLDVLLYGLGYAAGFVLELTKRLGGMGNAIKKAFNSGGFSNVLDKVADKADDILTRAFSAENVKKVSDRLGEMLGSDTFANLLKTALNAALIVSGFALEIGAQIAIGFIGALATAVPRILFGEGGAPDVAEMLKTFFLGSPGDSEKNVKKENDFESKARTEANAKMGEVLKNVWSSLVEAGWGKDSKVHVPTSVLKGSLGRVDVKDGGIKYTSPAELDKEEEIAQGRANRKSPIATTASAALGGSVNNQTTVGGDVTVNHGPTNVHVVVPPGTSPAQTKAHAEKAAEGVFNVKDAQSRRAAQQSLAPGGS